MNLAQYSPFLFDVADLLMAIVLALILGFSCGVWADLEDRRKRKRLAGRTLGEIFAGTAQERGEQVLRSQGLSISRLDGFETEGRLAHDYEPDAEQPADVQQHSEN